MEHFRYLAGVNLEIRAHGATADRLLRKSIFEINLGNFSAGLDSARDASDVKPDFAEAHYQQGMALLLLALSKAGIMACSAGMVPPIGSVKTLMEHAARALGEAHRLNPDDEEVSQDVLALCGFIDSTDDHHGEAVRAFEGN